MKHFFFVCLMLCSLSLSAQKSTAPKTSAIRKLETRQDSIRKALSKTSQIVANNDKTMRSELGNLGTLNGQINANKMYIETIGNEVKLVDGELSQLNDSLGRLQRQLELRKKNYAKSLQTLYRAKSFHEKLLFIFSSSTLQQAYRRARYLQDYAKYQRVMAGAVQQQQEKVNLKKQEMETVRSLKAGLLKEGEAKKQELVKQEQQKRGLIAKLEKQKKELNKEVSRLRQQANDLNKQIDRLVAIEVEKARQRALEEARQKAAADKKKTQSTSSTTASKGTKDTTPKMPTPQYSSEDVRLSGNFQSNRGRFPFPITGPYLVVEHYGVHSGKGELGRLKIDNQGINIQGQPGAQARAIFDGKVLAVFTVHGYLNVVVSHGSYLSMYCKLSSVSVSNGQEVSARQVLGQVYSDPLDGGRTILHFQLRKGSATLNPEQWLAR